MSDWLWHPNLDVRQRPDEEDYKVFPCSCCSAFRLYKILTIIVGIIWGLAFVGMLILFLSGKHWMDILLSSGLNPIELILVVIDLIFSIQAIRTMRPIFAQLLFPIYIILDAFSITKRVIFMVYAIRGDIKTNLGDGGVYGSIFGLVLTVIGVIWSFYLLYTFYKYLRDVKLHKEQAQSSEISGEAAAINQKETV
ncbi:unnamed protein product, partial [Mesorhabditis belari]|uniref:Uncharacterized protein n=1 Tax=Mesorhabditis belari TaxID=2138241 RepID=A0AAF3EWY0_9BILA